VSFFTLAYLARLELWWLVAACVEGGLVLASWWAWDRAMADATAAGRHRLACLHFAALTVLPAGTVAILHGTVAGMGMAPPQGSPSAELPMLMAGYRASLGLAIAWALLWFAGAAAMAWRLAGDARRIARLRPGPAPAEWVDTVHQLAQHRTGSTAPDVRVANIAAPQVVGLWRPVLLAPRELPHCLPAGEWEAVLLHELAHVQRRDFGWNLLQRLVLALLWFQPAAWRLYRHLSREREACCDELAVRNGASTAELARALVRLAENHASPATGMPISSQSDLGARVHRLLGRASQTRSPVRWRVAATAVSACCLLALGAGRLGRTDPALADLCRASAFGPTFVVDAHDDAGSFMLRIRRGRVLGASLERQPLPRDRIRQQGDRVTLLDQAQSPMLALIVTPQGRIEWKNRR